eukprot:31382-Pelagococcus_subviridis.AAC.5
MRSSRSITIRPDPPVGRRHGRGPARDRAEVRRALRDARDRRIHRVRHPARGGPHAGAEAVPVPQARRPRALRVRPEGRQREGVRGVQVRRRERQGRVR